MSIPDKLSTGSLATAFVAGAAWSQKGNNLGSILGSAAATLAICEMGERYLPSDSLPKKAADFLSPIVKVTALTTAAGLAFSAAGANLGPERPGELSFLFGIYSGMLATVLQTARAAHNALANRCTHALVNR